MAIRSRPLNRSPCALLPCDFHRHCLRAPRSARESAKNALEAYIYATREKLDGADADAIAAASSEGVLDAIREGLTTAEEWLYDDGASATTEEYRTRLAAVKRNGEPVFARVAEAEARPKLINETRTFIATGREVIAGWLITHPQVRGVAGSGVDI